MPFSFEISCPLCSWFYRGLLRGCFLFPGTFGVPCGYLTGINILPRYPEGTRKVPMEGVAGYFQGKEDGIFDGKHYFCG